MYGGSLKEVEVLGECGRVPSDFFDCSDCDKMKGCVDECLMKCVSTLHREAKSTQTKVKHNARAIERYIA